MSAVEKKKVSRGSFKKRVKFHAKRIKIKLFKAHSGEKQSGVNGLKLHLHVYISGHFRKKCVHVL